MIEAHQPPHSHPHPPPNKPSLQTSTYVGMVLVLHSQRAHADVGEHGHDSATCKGANTHTSQRSLALPNGKGPIGRRSADSSFQTQSWASLTRGIRLVGLDDGNWICPKPGAASHQVEETALRVHVVDPGPGQQPASQPDLPAVQRQTTNSHDTRQPHKRP